MNDDLDSNTQRIINKLFLTFEGIFPAFKTNYGTDAAYDNAKREWMKAFIAKKINDIEKIKIVCSECRKMESPFMLSIGKFISIYKSIGAYDKKYPMLDMKMIEVQKASEETVQSQMERIRAMLR